MGTLTIRVIVWAHTIGKDNVLAEQGGFMTDKWEYATIEYLQSCQPHGWVLISDQSIVQHPGPHLKTVKGQKVWKKDVEGLFYHNINPLDLVQMAAKDGWEMTHGLPIGYDRNSNQRRVSMMRRKL